MKPEEFWNCTYRELATYVNANSRYHEYNYKEQVILFDSLGNKILTALATKRPKNVSLIRETFKELFAEELQLKETPQTIEEQIRILRSMK